MIKYKIYKSSDNINYTFLKEVDNKSNIQLKEDIAGTYYYKISKVDERGESSLSDPIVVTVLKRPEPPQIIKESNKLKLKINKTDDADTFIIQKSLDRINWTNIYSGNEDIIDINVENHKQYIRTIAVKGKSKSNPSYETYYTPSELGKIDINIDFGYNNNYRKRGVIDLHFTQYFDEIQIFQNSIVIDTFIPIYDENDECFYNNIIEDVEENDTIYARGFYGIDCAVSDTKIFKDVTLISPTDLGVKAIGEIAEFHFNMSKNLNYDLEIRNNETNEIEKIYNVVSGIKNTLKEGYYSFRIIPNKFFRELFGKHSKWCNFNILTEKPGLHAYDVLYEDNTTGVDVYINKNNIHSTVILEEIIKKNNKVLVAKVANTTVPTIPLKRFIGSKALTAYELLTSSESPKSYFLYEPQKIKTPKCKINTLKIRNNDAVIFNYYNLHKEFYDNNTSSYIQSIDLDIPKFCKKDTDIEFSINILNNEIKTRDLRLKCNISPIHDFSIKYTHKTSETSGIEINCDINNGEFAIYDTGIPRYFDFDGNIGCIINFNQNGLFVLEVYLEDINTNEIVGTATQVCINVNETGTEEHIRIADCEIVWNEIYNADAYSIIRNGYLICKRFSKYDERRFITSIRDSDNINVLAHVGFVHSESNICYPDIRFPVTIPEEFDILKIVGKTAQIRWSCFLDEKYNIYIKSQNTEDYERVKANISGNLIDLEKLEHGENYLKIEAVDRYGTSGLSEAIECYIMNKPDPILLIDEGYHNITLKFAFVERGEELRIYIKEEDEYLEKKYIEDKDNTSLFIDYFKENTVYKLIYLNAIMSSKIHPYVSEFSDEYEYIPVNLKIPELHVEQIDKLDNKKFSSEFIINLVNPDLEDETKPYSYDLELSTSDNEKFYWNDIKVTDFPIYFDLDKLIDIKVKARAIRGFSITDYCEEVECKYERIPESIPEFLLGIGESDYYDYYKNVNLPLSFGSLDINEFFSKYQLALNKTENCYMKIEIELSNKEHTVSNTLTHKDLNDRFSDYDYIELNYSDCILSSIVFTFFNKSGYGKSYTLNIKGWNVPIPTTEIDIIHTYRNTSLEINLSDADKFYIDKFYNKQNDILGNWLGINLYSELTFLLNKRTNQNVEETENELKETWKSNQIEMIPEIEYERIITDTGFKKDYLIKPIDFYPLKDDYNIKIDKDNEYYKGVSFNLNWLSLTKNNNNEVIFYYSSLPSRNKFFPFPTLKVPELTLSLIKEGYLNGDRILQAINTLDSNKYYYPDDTQYLDVFYENLEGQFIKVETLTNIKKFDCIVDTGEEINVNLVDYYKEIIPFEKFIKLLHNCNAIRIEYVCGNVVIASNRLIIEKHINKNELGFGPLKSNFKYGRLKYDRPESHIFGFKGQGLGDNFYKVNFYKKR